ncbi:MAG TPA: NACHT domain-containing protein [Ktedonobacteraceae bacterium]|nr:NACHT domain-containing protein [Ktedonobacteraceae bacterium]
MHNTQDFQNKVQPFFPRQDQDEKRQSLLSTVWVTWITNALEAVPHREAFILLELVDLPEALLNPFHLEVQETRRSAQPLPSDSSITQMYDEAQGALLLLGEPGSGKTTMLLELTRELLLRANQYEDLPIPVVFHLSFWRTKKDLRLEEWLVEELQSKYWIPRHTAQMWVETEQLTLLIDGLDEAPEHFLAPCVQAINRYHREHPFVPLVVSSRREAYFEQHTRVQFQRAICIRPLTIERIHTFLSLAGERMAEVRKVLDEDPDVRDMIKTPLVLSIVVQALEGGTTLTSSSAEALYPKDWRRLILNVYVERMLNRRGKSVYTRAQTIHTLSLLAQYMQRHQQQSFSSEDMPPDWLFEGRPFQRMAALVLCRWFFWRKRVVSKRYAAFLNDACERMLLRRQEGGYTFAYRLLFEHFAQSQSLDI